MADERANVDALDREILPHLDIRNLESGLRLATPEWRAAKQGFQRLHKGAIQANASPSQAPLCRTRYRLDQDPIIAQASESKGLKQSVSRLITAFQRPSKQHVTRRT